MDLANFFTTLTDREISRAPLSLRSFVMMPSCKIVAIRDLAVGQPLLGDILDPDGKVLLRRGSLLLPNIVQSWTSQGFGKVYYRDDAEEEANPKSASGSSLLRQYNTALLEEIKTCTEHAKKAINDVVVDIAMNDDPSLAAIEKVLQTLQHTIDADADAVVFNAYKQNSAASGSNNDALAKRSVLMATLGVSTATQLGLSVNDCEVVAMAGLLHDVALFEETLAILLKQSSSEEARRAVLNDHPLHSATLAGRCRGISDQVRVVITQVHEQINGSGFPRQVSGHHLSVPGRILNLVDAFLTLTDPSHPSSIVPADALAYLVNHTTRGAFDYDCMKAFLSALSVYSVGSQVILDNKRLATVLRSSRTDPLRPIVQMNDDGNVIDLRESERFIDGPVQDANEPQRRRLSRSELRLVLWKPQLA